MAIGQEGRSEAQGVKDLLEFIRDFRIKEEKEAAAVAQANADKFTWAASDLVWDEDEE